AEAAFYSNDSSCSTWHSCLSRCYSRSSIRYSASFSLLMRPQPRSKLFPYTTLFRSQLVVERLGFGDKTGRPHQRLPAQARLGERSEEHTSELQSRGHLVCRLLLEKKKQKFELLRRAQITKEVFRLCTGQRLKCLKASTGRERRPPGLEFGGPRLTPGLTDCLAHHLVLTVI